ncbi:MAG TPA: CDP-alcohol phosphatidyltransferase family protein [Candidatus Limnocylindrales bacterium]|jgi:cardiolipin synthase|nr:CDP-alcohol phosphatidyltransferase family protein [Candidatus Limnocylindrales bacterium]
MIRQLKSTPNLLTLMRLVFVPLIVLAVVGSHYRWALAIFVLAGISDGLDGLLARLMKQQTQLGQYLDPIADKMLLSTMFLVLSFMRYIPRSVTILVFSRDIIIVIVCTLLYVTGAMKSFPPSFFGKANTAAQIVTVPFVLINLIWPHVGWIEFARRHGLNLVVILTIVSGVHYLWRLARELRNTGARSTPA